MIKRAMILAAGLGNRMRPLTDTTPKPLIKVNGKTLIDHKIDAALDAGIETVVVNVHYLADQLEQHLAGRHNPQIIISNERDALLDSGGGIFNAIKYFNDQPFYVLNSDTFWCHDNTPSLKQLASQWDPDQLDILMALADISQSVGFPGQGDFFRDDQGLLTRRGTAASAPLAFAGDYIVHPRIFRDLPEGPFSANMLFDRAIAAHRLAGHQLDGLWLHVGTPQSIIDAEHAIKLARA